jgi:hypothetical protein
VVKISLNSKWWMAGMCLAILLGWLAACSLQATPQQSSPANPTAAPATIAAPTDTAPPPTETFTPLPPTLTASPSPVPTATDTPEPTATATATPLPPTPPSDQAINIYLVQTGTGGPIACGDSLIRINTGLWRTGDNKKDIATALRSLLVKSKFIAGLYNPVYLSNLSLVGVDFNPTTGLATIDLSGTYVRSGDHCDDGRVHDQIWTTIRQFPGVKGNPLVRLNGNLLGDILSTAPGRESPAKTKKP